MKRILTAIALSTILFAAFPSQSLAKMVNLYQEPKTDAKVIQQIDLSAGVVPVYTPKEGGWIKVADPRNGNVGWIQSSDVNNPGGGSHSVTFTQQLITDGKANSQTPSTNQVFQFGQQPMTQEQQQAALLQMQKQQQEMQQNVNKAAQQIINNVNKMLINSGVPAQPVVLPVVPVQNAAPVQAPTAPVAAPAVNTPPVKK